MANPFFIEPANPLQALMSGQQGYDRAQKQGKEDEMTAARQRAAEVAKAGGDLKGPLFELIAGGDIPAARAVAEYSNQQATQQHQGAQLEESGRHNRAVEGLTAQQRDTTALQPVKLGTNLSGDVYGVRDPKEPSGYRIIDVNQMRGGQQPTGQPVQQATQGIISAVPQGGTDIAPQINAGNQPSVAPQQASTGRNEAFLKTLPADQQALIKGIVDYNVSPTTFSNRGQRERYLGAALQYDPSFSEPEYGNRFLTKRRFTSGPQGNTLRSMNVGIDHLSTLQEYADALKNGDVRLINTVAAKFKEQFGNDAPTNFNAVKAIVGSEVSKAIVGSQGALADREEIKHDLTTASSPAQLVGVIAAYKKLMAGQVSGLKQQYESSGLSDFSKYLSPPTLKELGLNNKGERAAAPASQTTGQATGGNVPEGATATNPKTGQRIIFKDGQWQPAQ